MASPVRTSVTVYKCLFALLDCFVTATVVYTLVTDGLPFRRDLLTPWMAATLVDFYIHVFVIAAWVAYKETNWIASVLWIVFLICLGSIGTCTFVIVQLFKLAPQDSVDPVYHILLRKNSRSTSETKCACLSVTTARFVFVGLGCLMLGTLLYTILTDGSPFRKELLTPWLTATLIDFYVNVIAIAVWISYKEAAWASALLWVLLLICFGSVTTCVYIAIQLLQLSPEDQLYLVLFKSQSRQVKPESIFSRGEVHTSEAPYQTVLS